MTRIFIPAAGLAMLIGSGVLYAIQTGHTRDPAVMEASAKRVDLARDISLEGWSSERIDFTEKQLRAAEAAGGGSVRYIEGAGGPANAAITVMLLCGPHGPISVHPPTACFQGVGYRQLGPQEHQQIKAADGTLLGTFWVTEFEQEIDGHVNRIRTWWAWSSDGLWNAPRNPRLTFAGEPVLYKLYIIERIGPGAKAAGGESAASAADDDVRRFAKSYLPRLKHALIKGGPSTTETL